MTEDINDETVIATQATIDEANDKAFEAGHEVGEAAGYLDGHRAANARIATILADEKIKGHEITAINLALKSPDMKADDVVEFVAGLPVASTHPTIAERMKGQGEAIALGGAPLTAPTAAASWAKVLGKRFSK